MRHARQHLERLRDVLASLDLGKLAHETNAARVAVVGGVEKTLRFGKDFPNEKNELAKSFERMETTIGTSPNVMACGKCVPETDTRGRGRDLSARFGWALVMYARVSLSPRNPCR